MNFPTNNDLEHAIAAYAESWYDEKERKYSVRLYIVTKHGKHPYYTKDVATGDP